jgi:hypothetical protein
MPQPKFDLPKFDFDVISQPAMPPPAPAQLVETTPALAKSPDPGHNPPGLNPPGLNPGRGDQR